MTTILFAVSLLIATTLAHLQVEQSKCNSFLNYHNIHSELQPSAAHLQVEPLSEGSFQQTHLFLPAPARK